MYEKKTGPRLKKKKKREKFKLNPKRETYLSSLIPSRFLLRKPPPHDLIMLGANPINIPLLLEHVEALLCILYGIFLVPEHKVDARHVLVVFGILGKQFLLR